MSTNSIRMPLTNQAKLKKYLPTKKRLKLLAKDLFHIIANLSKAQRRILNYFIYLRKRLPFKALYPSQSHIARVVGCCRQTANKCIQIVNALGLLISKPRPYFNGYRTNIYDVPTFFFKAQIKHELYTLLSSLREFPKKATQLEIVNINSKSNYVEDSIQTDKKDENLTPEQDPPDPMSWSIDVFRQLATRNEPIRPSVAQTPTAQKRSGGFKRLGGLF